MMLLCVTNHKRIGGFLDVILPGIAGIGTLVFRLPLMATSNSPIFYAEPNFFHYFLPRAVKL